MRVSRAIKPLAIAGLAAGLAMAFALQPNGSAVAQEGVHLEHAFAETSRTIKSVSATAPEKVHWRMQSIFGSSLPHLGTSAVQFSKTVALLSGGTLQIEFFEPGALIPAGECFDAVSKGTVESCWTASGMHADKYPALAFFSAVPFGPGFGEFIAWKWFGGGNALRDEIYRKHNLIAFDSLAHGPETSGWFRNEITSVDQLKALKIRFFGLGARVMKKMGAETQLLPAADIYPALERGAIDATEFSMPLVDINLGFYQVAKFNYFPGWHQQVSADELLINRDRWEALSEQHQAIIKTALGDNMARVYAETEYANPKAMREMGTKYGAKTMRWPDKTLALLEKAWMEVVEEESAKDPLFRQVAESYFGFREQYKIWGEAQALKSTYLK